MSVAALDWTACANCGKALTGPYCGACGQKIAPPNPTIGDFVHELAHELVHVDGKIFRSLRLLVTAPGALTAEQFAGRRVRYVSPIRLYLTFSVLFFAVSALAPDRGSWVTVGGKGSSGFSVRSESVRRESNPDELRKLGFASEEDLQTTVNEAVVHWAPRAMFLLVPLFAAMIGVAVRRSGRNYPQQLYFALHVHTAWFLFLTFGAATRFAPWPAVWRIGSSGALVAMFVYLVLALRRAYGLTFKGGMGRAVVVSFAYGVLVIATLAAIVLPTILGRG